MSSVGIVFSNIHDRNISELTRNRTLASVPFGCRYRLIDFTLSNMVNSGIRKVGVITQYNYQSLMDHLGTGKDWDLASRAGGIKILPPYISAYVHNGNTAVSTRLEALKGATDFITRCREEYVVLSDCDVICNIDLRDIIDFHAKNNADITIATKRVKLSKEIYKNNVILESDDDGLLRDMFVYPTDMAGEHDISLNIMVMRRDFLQSILLDAIAHGFTSFNTDIIYRNIGVYNIRTYRYDGYFACISSLAEYYNCNMELLCHANRHALFNVKDRPVLTKVRNSSPTQYAENVLVKNSLIADGCVIEGTVENSIIFRGVKISRGSHIKNSIIMQDSYIGENTNLNCVIADKNVVIKDGRTLSGHETLPFYLEKGAMI